MNLENQIFVVITSFWGFMGLTLPSAFQVQISELQNSLKENIIIV